MFTTPVRTRPRTILVVALVAAALLLAGLALVDPTAAQSEPATTTTAPTPRRCRRARPGHRGTSCSWATRS